MYRRYYVQYCSVICVGSGSGYRRYYDDSGEERDGSPEDKDKTKGEKKKPGGQYSVIYSLIFQPLIFSSLIYCTLLLFLSN